MFLKTENGTYNNRQFYSLNHLKNRVKPETFFGIPATNKDVDVIGCTIATIVNGKITEEQDFFDNLVFLLQLGLMAK